ncbi:alpha/beta hydrolase [Streptomyces sp. Tu 3180]|uniref:alpha/beta hydrolase n=1 Tax=Streptomyces sp. Tu 3180 TaxID=2682611 RepID=UPI00135B956A|nr:alpha/beta hydrolase [Streptomyces sp. Tu 3180]KAF3465129.1 alpha/beta hydrolase [Streptomyces sp. Tu 3180]
MTRIKWNAALLAASAAVLSLTVSLTTATASAPAAAAPGPPPLEWTRCEGTGLDPRQECATVEVPMDHADPRGERITLAVSRIPAEDPEARRGALFMIPGGPGGGSIDDPSDKGWKLPRQVRDAYDLIGFDPRGYGRSTPVSCDVERGDLARTKLLPWPAPDGSVTESMATARRISRACARNGGELMRHISTADEARDLDRIRAALGERKISAWGLSYGSYVGAVYNQLFPHRTDRFVLDSNPGPDPTWAAGGWFAAFEAGAEDNFPEFAEWASAPRNPDRVAGTPAKVRALFLRLAARLDREPLPWPGANPEELNGNVFRQAMLDSLYDPDDYPALARLMRAVRRGTVPPAPQAPPESLLQNVTAIAAGTLCNDAAWPASAAVYEKGVAESRAAYPLTAGMPRNAPMCAAWPYPPKEPPVRITDRGPSTVLLVQNRRDVATPLSGALELREALGRRAVMVTVDSTGHDAYLANGNACGDRTVSRFLATGERPDRDVTCA